MQFAKLGSKIQPNSEILHFYLRNGSYGLVEIKLGGSTAIEEAQHSLNALTNKIDTSKAGEPAFRMILTAVGSYALTMSDGTLVVPIGCLKD